jgi:hypothetical protein
LANLTVSKSLTEWAQGKFTVEGEPVLLQQGEAPGEVQRPDRDMATAGEDPTPLMKFWERLQRNPSFRSVQQLWNFMDHEGIPLTPEGTFLTYKSINGDLTDHHTGQVDNTPGVVNEMPRNKISDDPNEACHYGYHVGALPLCRELRKGKQPQDHHLRGRSGERRLRPVRQQPAQDAGLQVQGTRLPQR